MAEHRENLDYTGKAWDVFYDSVDGKQFVDADAETIFDTLSAKELLVSFGDYLKRYICEKAELAGDEQEIPLAEYQAIIRDSFAERHTPPSFRETSAKLGALSKNWLTQRSVKREVVFLLGFGLGMSTEDVNEFLSKALGERGINPKNPYEVLCWYCYERGYDFLKYRQLREQFEAKTGTFRGNEGCGKDISRERTVLLQRSMRGIHDDDSLFGYLSTLKTRDNRILLSVTARTAFDMLYEKTRLAIAEMYNRDKIRRYTINEIGPSDVEHIFCAAIPSDKHGNLTPAKASALNTQFAGKRFSRQHLGDILNGHTDVSRFDLITLNFFIYSQKEYQNIRKRYTEFLESTNGILESCLMGEIYIQNAYEAFVLMCMLTEDPLCAYSDVLAIAYSVS